MIKYFAYGNQGSISGTLYGPMNWPGMIPELRARSKPGN